MTFNYAKSAETAKKLLTKFGKDQVITHIEQGEYDPILGGSVDVETTLNGVGVMLNYDTRQIDGTQIISGDKKLLWSGARPSIGDKFLDYRIVNIIELNPTGDVSVLFTIQLRGGTQ